ncbi:MAG: N-acetyltransferase [Enterocloster sp.]
MTRDRQRNGSLEGEELELYVILFKEGIGGALVEFAVRMFGVQNLFVLEKNVRAIRFYQRHGFSLTHERQIQEGTAEYKVRMKRLLPVEQAENREI